MLLHFVNNLVINQKVLIQKKLLKTDDEARFSDSHDVLLCLLDMLRAELANEEDDVDNDDMTESKLQSDSDNNNESTTTSNDSVNLKQKQKNKVESLVNFPHIIGASLII